MREKQGNNKTIIREAQKELHQCDKCDINVKKKKAMRKKWQQH
jgi:hypothetical protein